MRSEITEIKRAISTICSKQGRQRSVAGLTTRTDVPSARHLSGEFVDAALADDAISFVPAPRTGVTMREDHSQMVAGLTAQLAQLESQCTHLRQLLEVASRR